MFLSLFCDKHKNYIIMNDYILIFIVAAYICVGVFVVVWMDENYFDRKGNNKSVEGWWWKMAIWPVLVPFVYSKIRRIKKQKAAQARADFEAMMARWEGLPEEPKEMVIEGHVLVRGIAGEPIPDTVTEIGEEAFFVCDALEEVVIPASVRKIGKEAFRCCSNMTQIVIPDSVTEICDGAFDECDSLGEIHLPASLRKLGDILGDQPVDVYCHFADPTQCEVSYDKDEPESWSNNMDNWLYVPQGSRALYEKTEPWCYFETIKEF